MINAYKLFYSHYFDFKGKTTRANYWWVFVVNLLILFAIYFLVAVAAGVSILNPKFSALSAGPWIIIIIGILWTIFNIIPSITLGIRRVRDTGLTPWLWLLFPIGNVLYNPDLVVNPNTAFGKGAITGSLVGLVLLLAYIVITLLPSKEK